MSIAEEVKIKTTFEEDVGEKIGIQTRKNVKGIVQTAA